MPYTTYMPNLERFYGMEWQYEFSIRFVWFHDEDRQKFIEQAIGYAASVKVRGERPTFDWLLPGNLVVYLDITKSARDDIGDCYAEFWELLEQILTERKAPLRKRTNDHLFLAPKGESDCDYEDTLYDIDSIWSDEDIR